MGQKIVRKNFPVTGMSCAACAARVNKALSKQPGVKEANVNYAAASARIVFDPEICSPETLKQTVERAGYGMVTDMEKNPSEVAEKEFKKNYLKLRLSTFSAIAMSLAMFLTGMLAGDQAWTRYAAWGMSTVTVFVFGSRFFKGAIQQLKHFSSNMDTLVATSTFIAYIYSVFNLFFPGFWLSRGLQPHLYFESAGMIIAFILLGRMLEARAKRKTTSSIRKLMGLKPKTVTIATESGECTASVDDIVPGDVVIVHPGERIAADGCVTEGLTSVDESMLNGEPLPTEKKPGDKVFAGTINGNGSFRFEVATSGEDTLLSRIIRMVQDAQGSKAPVQQAVDKVAGIFVPVIIGISVLTFACWMIFAPSEGFSHGLVSMITVLIIACPCALGLATPTAIMVGIGKGAEAGILIKDAESLETAKRTDTVVLDKTGTITEGHPKVRYSCWETEDRNLSNILYSLEKLASHPLAEAITGSMHNASAVGISGFRSIPGRGVKGIYGNTLFLAGNRKMMEEERVTLSGITYEKGKSWEEEGASVVWFAGNGKTLACFAISDSIKPGSASAVRTLESMGVKVIMLTGDNESSAARVAAEAGIREFHASMLPDAKAEFIRKLQKDGHTVAMAGDGINDSAALATADLGIAMGQGSDIAIDTAMVAILNSDLEKIPEMIHLSRHTVRTIRENLFWAFIYNIIAIPVAAGILYPINGFLIDPAIGGAAMAFSSVSVVSNSLRLKFKKF